jgi:putative membrane protein
VLIYVALAERYADVVTDVGIGPAPEAWQAVLAGAGPIPTSVTTSA